MQAHPEPWDLPGCPLAGGGQWHLVGKGEMNEYQLFFGVLTRPAAPWAELCPHGLGERGRDLGDSSLHPVGAQGPLPSSRLTQPCGIPTVSVRCCLE